MFVKGNVVHSIVTIGILRLKGCFNHRCVTVAPVFATFCFEVVDLRSAFLVSYSMLVCYSMV